MNILLAPQISEKATYVAEKFEQVIFRVVSDATKPEIKAAVDLMFKVTVETVYSECSQSGKKKRFGKFWSAQGLEEGICLLGARSGNKFCYE